MPIAFSDDSVAQRFFELCENVAVIKEQMEEVKEMKVLVTKHETAYNVGKVAAVPALGLFHIMVKHVLTKFGW